MPIYEYLCPHCNRIFSFLSQTLVPKQAPACPKCGTTDLRKQLSRFAVVGATRKSSGKETGADPAAATGAPDDTGTPPPGADDGASPLDDPRVEQEMEKLMADAEGVDENDPRQLGRLMRKMSEITGEKMDGDMETAIRRLEKGEDPEKIEEDMGDVLGGDEAGGPGGRTPDYDDGLYSM
jgi:putative FmdB family regulatory protein